VEAAARVRVLLIEDDALLGEALQTGLRQRGFVVDWQRDGAAGLAAAQSEDYQALVLDLGLPRLEGTRVLERLRAAHSTVPIVVLTAREAITERVTQLDAGADDYIVKPVDLDELAARIRAVVRRRAGAAHSRIEVGDLVLDLAARTVTRAGVAVALQPREFLVLESLALNAGRVVTRAQLDARIYGWGEEVDSNALEVHVHHLRRKLGADTIRTVRGVGYLMPAER
jgi:two-component system OmpR family response regulator/two-component system response regulator QseB